MTLGDDIREARERAQLTQPELAKLVGVGESTISNWERGVVRTPKNRLARVREILADYWEPRVGRTSTNTPAADEFDADAVVANLTSEQLAVLAARLPDHIMADDVARRLRRGTAERPSVPSRTWSVEMIPPDPTAAETSDGTGEQPA